MLFSLLFSFGLAVAQEDAAPNHRLQPPVVESPEPIALPEFQTTILDNGTTVHYLSQKGLLKSTVQVRMFRGMLKFSG